LIARATASLRSRRLLPRSLRSRPTVSRTTLVVAAFVASQLLAAILAAGPLAPVAAADGRDATPVLSSSQRLGEQAVKVSSLGTPALETASNPGYPYPCGTQYGAVIVTAAAWASQLGNVSQDGAGYDVYSNYGYDTSSGGSDCDRPPYSGDQTDAWGTMYQCAELAMRAADAEWGTGSEAAWKNVGWNGAAYDMYRTGPILGLTQVQNGTGSLPAEGDLLIWASKGDDDPGHVAVVSSVGSGVVNFVGQNQGNGISSVGYKGSTLDGGNSWRGSEITGWLTGPDPVGHSGLPLRLPWAAEPLKRGWLRLRRRRER
jgi:hypothetical protein